MSSDKMQRTAGSCIWHWIWTSVFLLIIFSCLLVLRAPILSNADLFFTYDEAYQGSQILDLLKGAPLFFYYEGERYAGIFLGLLAAPFFRLLGVSALAYKLPGTLAYALYVLSTYWIVKKINPAAAITVVFLMIFSPYIVLFISSNNWQHNWIIFLGNILFLLFFKIKESINPKASVYFLLGASMGFSIYSYTYSILYIATVAILSVLTHKNWGRIREKLLSWKLFDWYKKQTSLKMKFVRILDVIILFFVVAISFSYVFGGFGFDIAGYSILQINTLHKPVGQLLILITIRLLTFRKDLNWENWEIGQSQVLAFLRGIAPVNVLLFGILGFLAGIFPRIISILMGETKNGGQGFDMDFNPLQLLMHFWELFTFHLPQFFDIQASIMSLIISEWSVMVIVRGVLAIMMIFLILKSIHYFFASRWNDLKNIALIKSVRCEPGLVIIVFSFLLCSAVVVLQNGTDIRYLLPIHGVVSIWVAIYLDKIRLSSKVLFSSFLLIWCGFWYFNTYYFYTKPIANYPYQTAKVVEDFSIIKHSTPYPGLAKYCEDNKILHVYSDSLTSPMLNFYGNGHIIASRYEKNRNPRRMAQILSRENKFVIIINAELNHHLDVYIDHLDKYEMTYSIELVKGEFWVLKDFGGSLANINPLRDLIPEDF